MEARRRTLAPDAEGEPFVLPIARAVGVVANDYFEDNLFIGPKAYLLAQAQQFANRPESAADLWQIAEQKLRDRLRDRPSQGDARGQLAVVMAALGRHGEARETANSLSGRRTVAPRIRVELAYAYTLIGDSTRALEILHTVVQSPGYPLLGAYGLLKEPRWDALREHPEFAALVRAYAAADGVNIIP